MIGCYTSFSITAVITNTRLRKVFSLCWNLINQQSTVSMVFTRFDTESCLIVEERRFTRIEWRQRFQLFRWDERSQCPNNARSLWAKWNSRNTLYSLRLNLRAPLIACNYNVTNEKWLPDIYRYFFRLEIALVIHSEDHSVRVVCSELKHLENYTQPNAPGKIWLMLFYI